MCVLESLTVGRLLGNAQVARWQHAREARRLLPCRCAPNRSHGPLHRELIALVRRPGADYYSRFRQVSLRNKSSLRPFKA